MQRHQHLILSCCARCLTLQRACQDLKLRRPSLAMRARSPAPRLLRVVDQRGPQALVQLGHELAHLAPASPHRAMADHIAHHAASLLMLHHPHAFAHAPSSLSALPLASALQQAPTREGGAAAAGQLGHGWRSRVLHAAALLHAGAASAPFTGAAPAPAAAADAAPGVSGAPFFLCQCLKPGGCWPPAAAVNGQQRCSSRHVQGSRWAALLWSGCWALSRPWPCKTPTGEKARALGT